MKQTRKTMHLGAKASTFQNAYHLRRRETKGETILWEHLRNRKMEGVKFRRQHPIKRYVLDFYAHELKFVIEIDEKYHLEKGQIFSDEDRDKILGRHKLLTIRFKEEQVLYNMDVVLNEIRKKIIALKFVLSQQVPYKIPEK